MAKAGSTVLAKDARALGCFSLGLQFHDLLLIRGGIRITDYPDYPDNWSYNLSVIRCPKNRINRIISYVVNLINYSIFEDFFCQNAIFNTFILPICQKKLICCMCMYCWQLSGLSGLSG